MKQLGFWNVEPRQHRDIIISSAPQKETISWLRLVWLRGFRFIYTLQLYIMWESKKKQARSPFLALPNLCFKKPEPQIMALYSFHLDIPIFVNFLFLSL